MLQRHLTCADFTLFLILFSKLAEKNSKYSKICNSQNAFSLAWKETMLRRVQPKMITNFTSRPFESSLADFCTSKNSKNQLWLPPKKQMVKFSKVQKSKGNFSPGLNFRLNLDYRITSYSFLP